MQPALNPDTRESSDYVFLSRWAVHNYSVERGDIVSLISPRDPDQKIIKRVVAFQGDVVATLGYKKPFVRIPDGHCWVEGDHTGIYININKYVLNCINQMNTKCCWLLRQLVGQQFIWTHFGWSHDGPCRVHRLATRPMATTAHLPAQATPAHQPRKDQLQQRGLAIDC